MATLTASAVLAALVFAGCAGGADSRSNVVDGAGIADVPVVPDAPVEGLASDPAPIDPDDLAGIDAAGADAGAAVGDADPQGAEPSAADGALPGPGLDVASEDAATADADAAVDAVVVDVGPDGPAAVPVPVGSLVGFSVPPGTFSAPFALRLGVAAPDVQAFFTVDGSVPTTAATAWNDATVIDVATTTTVRVLAVRGPQQQIQAALYLQVTDALASAFSSNLPLVFLHAFAAVEPQPTNFDNTTGGIVVNAPRAGIARPVDVADTVGRMGFRVRGRSSRVWDQRSYTVELWEPGSDDDAAWPVLGLPAESDWVLYGPWTVDRSLLRNAFLYALSNRIGRYAPRTRFVEVFMQSAGKPIAAADYRGVYTLVEKLKRDPQRVNIANLRPTDETAAAITGGYLFKIDEQLSPGEVSLSAAGHVMELEEPNWDDITVAQRTYLGDFLTDFAAAANAADGRNPRTGMHYSDYIDVDSFIDFHIINVFAKNPDALRLSAYYHKDRGGKLVAGPLWDLDRTTGANDERVTSAEGWTAPFGTEVFSYGWWAGLFRDPAFEARYWARWEALLASDLRSDVFAAIIGPMASDLATAQQRHFDRWTSVRPPYGYLPEILRLTTWLDARVAWVKSNLRKR